MVVTFDTDWPSDSVEFCPNNPRSVFVCGTYKLDEPPEDPLTSSEVQVESRKQHRRGKCLVFEVTSFDDKDM